MKTITITLLMCFLFGLQARAQSGVDLNDPNVIIEYKKYESFDLGNLEIQGTLIAPGDLSVQERDRRRFSRSLFERENFDAEVAADVKHLR